VSLSSTNKPSRLSPTAYHARRCLLIKIQSTLPLGGVVICSFGFVALGVARMERGRCDSRGTGHARPGGMAEIRKVGPSPGDLLDELRARRRALALAKVVGRDARDRSTSIWRPGSRTTGSGCHLQ
jgi:hypothetical protein